MTVHNGEDQPQTEEQTNVAMAVSEMTLKMLQLQAGFNTKTNGIEWIKDVTKEGLDIDWGMCIHREAVEMMDSFPWEHWKGIGREPDLTNYEVEATDVWHFIMSSVISLAGGSIVDRRIKDAEEAELETPVFDNQDILDLGIEGALATLDYDSYKVNLAHILECYDTNNLSQLKSLTRSFCMIGDEISNVISHFMLIMLILERDHNFGFEELYKLYIGKNALNVVRQQNGYKEGTYKKIWKDGKEDNVFMREYVMIQPVEKLELDAVVAQLTKMYDTYTDV